MQIRQQSEMGKTKATVNVSAAYSSGSVLHLGYLVRQTMINVVSTASEHKNPREYMLQKEFCIFSKCETQTICENIIIFGTFQ